MDSPHSERGESLLRKRYRSRSGTPPRSRGRSSDRSVTPPKRKKKDKDRRYLSYLFVIQNENIIIIK